MISVVPHPLTAVTTGGSFHLAQDAAITVATPSLAAEAEYLARLLRCVTGYALPVSAGAGASGAGGIYLGELAGSPAEAYRLSVAPVAIVIEGGAAAGVFYGIQTLLQLLPAAVFGTGPRAGVCWHAPCCTITDAPRFRWRGMMLDSARHFQPPELIKRWIDLLALHKFNVFHWHLTDHQGWRVPIDRYPRLTEIGAWRGGTARGHYFAMAEDDGERYGGYYTKAQLRDIVAYAAERHITIIPEIEMPGHCQAALAAYPELGLGSGQLEVSRRWGGHPAIFNLEEPTFAFLFHVLEEVLEIFPSDKIHIGGDEAASREWEQDPRSLERMRVLGLNNAKEAHAWFIGRIGEFLQARGRSLAGWDEITEPELPATPTILSWRGASHGAQAAALGYEVVMCPYHATYFDYYQAPQSGAEPLANCDLNIPYVDLRMVYAFEPVSPLLAKADVPQVIGVQGQLWTEYIPDRQTLEYMAFPRACALAEVAWSERSRRDYPSFLQRLKCHLQRLNCLMVNYRKTDF